MKRLVVVFPIVLLLAIASVAQQHAVVRVERTNVYGTPRTTGVVVETVARGSEVNVYEADEDWALVQTGDYAGWVRSDALILIAGGHRAISTIAAPAISSSPARTPVSEAVRPTTIVTVPVSVREETRRVSTNSERPPATPETTSAATRVDDAAEERAPTGIRKDGTETFAVDRQSACSNHGGTDSWYSDKTTTPTTPSTQAPTNSSGDVQVKGYYRKDGTYVRPYTRSSPGGGSRKKP